MCAALCGVLAVDEGVIFLAVLVGMGESYFDVLALEVDDVVEALAGHVVLQQVLQAVAREDALSVVDEGQSRVEVGVVAQQVLHELVLEAEADEQRVVRLEVDVGAGFLRGVLGDVALQHAPFEHHGTDLAVAVAAHLEPRAQRVHRLDAHTVQAHALLERLRVVLAARVQFAHRFHQFALGDAASIVAHADAAVVLDGYFDFLACAHLELVYRVVYRLLQQHVDAVVALRAVAQASYVHAGAYTDVLHVVQVADVLLGVVHPRGLRGVVGFVQR